MNWFLPPYKAHVLLAECSNVSTWPFLVGSFLVNWLLSVWPWPFQHHGCPPSAVWPGWQTSAACQHIPLTVQMQTHSFSLAHLHKCAEVLRCDREGLSAEQRVHLGLHAAAFRSDLQCRQMENKMLHESTTWHTLLTYSMYVAYSTVL